MALFLRLSCGTMAEVYAIDLNGGGSPGVMRYGLCPELRTAPRLDVFCDSSVLPLLAGERGALVEDGKELPVRVVEVFHFRDETRVQCVAAGGA